MLLEHQAPHHPPNPLPHPEGHSPNPAPLPPQTDATLLTQAYASAQRIQISLQPLQFQANTTQNQFLTNKLTQAQLTNCLETANIEIIYQNNDSYIGKVSNSYLLTPNSTPKKYFDMKDVENGKFLRSGEGTYAWVDGGVYQGSFENNLPNGEGSLIRGDGSEYGGRWEDGSLSGDKCVVLYHDDHGSLDKYEGGFVGGFAEGRGKLTFKLGDVFKGFFRNGFYDGKGTMRYSNGDAYDGKYVEGLPHGDGTFHYKSANIFQNTKLQGGICRVSSSEFTNSLFDLKSKKPGCQTIPASMCQVAMRANPNKNLAKSLLGSLFDRDTGRVIKSGKKGKAKTTNNSNKTTAATTAKTTAKNSIRKIAQTTLKKRTPEHEHSTPRSRSIRRAIKKVKRSRAGDPANDVVTPQLPKFDLTSRKRGITVDMRQIFGGPRCLTLKRATSIDLCILAAKATLRKNKNIIVD